jgi:hypothetical protein
MNAKRPGGSPGKPIESITPIGDRHDDERLAGRDGGSARDEVLSPPDRDRLEARMDVECFQDVADVVPHGLDAEVELLRDLIGRVTLFQQSQDLGLAWRQARMRRRRRGILFNLLDLAEDADHVAPALKRHATHLHRYALSVGRQEDGSIVRAPRRAHEVTGEDLAPTASFLGRKDGGHLAASHVAHDPLCGPINPADDPMAVDHIGGDTDPLDRVFELTSHGLQLGHAFESAPRAAAAQPRNFPSEDVFY